MGQRQTTFMIDKNLWKEFGKKCLDLEKSKTKVLVQLIKDFLHKKK